jgi:glycosyltransferase AglD
MTLVSLFIPGYNEEKIIEENLIKVMRVIGDLPWDFEVFFVDDSSTDRTPQLVSKLAERYRDLTPLRYENGPSRRENLAESFKKARGNIIMFMDADLATDLKNIPTLIRMIEDGYDIATGSRHIGGTVSKRLLSRRLISFFYKHFVKFYFNSKINDHECGFKAFRREVILDLLNHLGYDYQFKRKMTWDTEMLLIAQKKRYKIKEIPVIWSEGAKSTLRFRTELSIIPYLLTLKNKLKKIK